MVNLGRLRCLQPGCTRERPLLVQPDGMLVCPSCGAARPAPDHFRVYRGRTGQWIIAGAIWLSVGYGRTGVLRPLLLAVGALFVLYGLGRLAWGALALRTLQQDRIDRGP